MIFLGWEFPPTVSAFVSGLAVPCLALLFTACVAPIGAERVTTRQAYAQLEANALRTGRPSANTVSLLHRYDLVSLASQRPDQAVLQLHQKALATGERDLLFALAELSYLAGDHIRRSVKPWDPRDARDYYLGSAVYAWLFLFGEGKDVRPGAFDRRFREACDLNNITLGLALSERRNTNGSVRLESVRRRLPVGEIDLRLVPNEVASQLDQFEQVLLADQYRVRGLSRSNREAGVGTPLMAILPINPAFGMRRAVPATVLLRLHGSLVDLANNRSAGELELYSPFERTNVTLGQVEVPLETDLTTYRAYVLNQDRVWKLGLLQFLAPSEHIRSQLLLNQPYEPGCIPVVFVHGTFSSPVTWAEMANTLAADPVLRRRYQFWSFIYGSGNPLLYSIADLRAALTAEVQLRDPQGTNVALHQMVVIGHSQGGLLTKGTVVDSGNRLWRVFSAKPLEQLNATEAQRAELRRLFSLAPLPFVQRVVFIATPHRGSYRSQRLARGLAQRFVSLPRALLSRETDLLRFTKDSDAAPFLEGKMPTSLDGMSPKNPGLLALAEIPVASSVKAHSIVSVKGNGDYHDGRDGLVTYQSAHLEPVESESIVRSGHSCLEQPATIEEVRRILHEHLKGLGAQTAEIALPGGLKPAARAELQKPSTTP